MIEGFFGKVNPSSFYPLKPTAFLTIYKEQRTLGHSLKVNQINELLILLT